MFNRILSGKAKYIFLFSVLFFCTFISSCVSSSIPAETDTYQKIVETSKDKSACFSSTMQWLTYSFPSSKAVIEYSDAQSGTIMGNILISVNLGSLNGPSLVQSLLSFEIKDNKARITFSKIKRNYSDMGKSAGDQLAKSMLENQALTQEEYNTIIIEIDKIISNYESFISKNNSNW